MINCIDGYGDHAVAEYYVNDHPFCKHHMVIMLRWAAQDKKFIKIVPIARVLEMADKLVSKTGA